MPWKYLPMEAIVACILLLSPRVCAEEYELTYKITDPSQGGAYVGGNPCGRRHNRQKSSPPSGLGGLMHRGTLSHHVVACIFHGDTSRNRRPQPSLLS